MQPLKPGKDHLCHVKILQCPKCMTISCLIYWCRYNINILPSPSKDGTLRETIKLCISFYTITSQVFNWLYHFSMYINLTAICQFTGSIQHPTHLMPNFILYPQIKPTPPKLSQPPAPSCPVRINHHNRPARGKRTKSPAPRGRARVGVPVPAWEAP